MRPTSKDILRDFRIQAHQTQSEFAQRLGCSEAFVSQVLNGSKRLPIERLEGARNTLAMDDETYAELFAALVREDPSYDLVSHHARAKFVSGFYPEFLAAVLSYHDDTQRHELKTTTLLDSSLWFSVHRVALRAIPTLPVLIVYLSHPAEFQIGLALRNQKMPKNLPNQPDIKIPIGSVSKLGDTHRQELRKVLENALKTFANLRNARTRNKVRAHTS